MPFLSNIPIVAVLLLLVVTGIVILEIVILIRKKKSGSSATTPFDKLTSTINPQTAANTGQTPPPAQPQTSPQPQPATITSNSAPIGTQPQTPAQPETKPPEKLDKKLVIATIVTLLLSLAIPITVFLVSQNQEVRSRADVVSNIPTIDLETASTTQDTDSFGIINTASLQTPRTNPSIVFVNAAPINQDEGIRLLIKNKATGETVFDDAGFGGLQIAEYTLFPNDYTVTIDNSVTNQTYFTKDVTIAAQTVNILMRTNSNAQQGNFNFHHIPFSVIPDLRVYNLTNDNSFSVFGGSLTNYNGLTPINPNAYLDLPVSNPEMILFGMKSSSTLLNNQFINIANSRRVKVILFVLGDRVDAIATAVLIPLAPVYTTPKLTQTTVHDSTPVWCEGKYTCKLINSDCSDCGKYCIPTPNVCQPNANGGSGANWNGQKLITP